MDRDGNVGQDRGVRDCRWVGGRTGRAGDIGKGGVERLVAGWRFRDEGFGWARRGQEEVLKQLKVSVASLSHRSSQLLCPAIVQRQSLWIQFIVVRIDIRGGIQVEHILHTLHAR